MHVFVEGRWDIARKRGSMIDSGGREGWMDGKELVERLVRGRSRIEGKYDSHGCERVKKWQQNKSKYEISTLQNIIVMSQKNRTCNIFVVISTSAVNTGCGSGC